MKIFHMRHFGRFKGDAIFTGTNLELWCGPPQGAENFDVTNRNGSAFYVKILGLV